MDVRLIVFEILPAVDLRLGGVNPRPDLIGPRILFMGLDRYRGFGTPLAMAYC
jgi:hypothetical protein